MSDSSSDFGPAPTMPIARPSLININNQFKLPPISDKHLIPGVTNSITFNSSSVCTQSEIKSTLYKFKNEKKFSTPHICNLIQNLNLLLGFESVNKINITSMSSGMQSQRIKLIPQEDIISEYNRVSKIDINEATSLIVHNLNDYLLVQNLDLLQIRSKINEFMDIMIHIDNSNLQLDEVYILFHQLLIIVKIISQSTCSDYKKMIRLIDQFADFIGKLSVPEVMKQYATVVIITCKIHNFEGSSTINPLLQKLIDILTNVSSNLQTTIKFPLFCYKNKQITLFNYHLFENQDRFFNIDTDFSVKSMYFSVNTHLTIISMCISIFQAMVLDISPLDGLKQQHKYFSDSFHSSFYETSKAVSTQDFSILLFTDQKQRIGNKSVLPPELSDSFGQQENIIHDSFVGQCESSPKLNHQFDEDMEIIQGDKLEENELKEHIKQLLRNENNLLTVFFSMRTIINVQSLSLPLYTLLAFESQQTLQHLSGQSFTIDDSIQHIKQINIPSIEEAICVFILCFLKQNSSGAQTVFGAKNLLVQVFSAAQSQLKVAASQIKQSLLEYIDDFYSHSYTLNLQSRQQSFMSYIQTRNLLASTYIERKEYSKGIIVLLNLFIQIQKYQNKADQSHLLFYREQLLSLSYDLANYLFQYNEFNLSQEFFCYACSLETHQKVIYDERRINKLKYCNNQQNTIGENKQDRLIFLEIVHDTELASFLFDTDSNISQTLSEKSDISQYKDDLSNISSRGLDIYLRRVHCYQQVGKLKQALYILSVLKKLTTKLSSHQFIMKFKILLHLCKITTMRSPQTCQTNIEWFVELQSETYKNYNMLDIQTIFDSISIIAEFYMRTGHPCEAFYFIMQLNDMNYQNRNKFEIDTSLMLCQFFQLLSGVNPEFSITQVPIQFPYQITVKNFVVGKLLIKKYDTTASKVEGLQSILQYDATENCWIFNIQSKHTFSNLFISSHLRALLALEQGAKLEKRVETMNQIIFYWLLKYFAGGDYKLVIQQVNIVPGKYQQQNGYAFGYTDTKDQVVLDFNYVSKMFISLLSIINSVNNVKLRLQVQLNYCQFLIYRKVNLQDIGILLENSVLLYYSHYMAGPLVIPFLLDFLPQELIELKIILNRIISISLQLTPAPSYTQMLIDAQLITDLQLKNILSHALYPKIDSKADFVEEDDDNIVLNISQIFKDLPYNFFTSSTVPISSSHPLNNDILNYCTSLKEMQYESKCYFNYNQLNSNSYTSNKQQRSQQEQEISQILNAIKRSTHVDRNQNVGVDRDSINLYKAISDNPDYKVMNLFPQIMRHTGQIFKENHMLQTSHEVQINKFSLQTDDNIVFQFTPQSSLEQSTLQLNYEIDKNLAKMQFYVQQISNSSDILKAALSNIFNIDFTGNIYQVVQKLYNDQSQYSKQHFSILYLNSMIAITDFQGNVINIFMGDINITTLSNIKIDEQDYKSQLPFSGEVLSINGKLPTLIASMPASFAQRICLILLQSFMSTCRSYDMDNMNEIHSYYNDNHLLFGEFIQGITQINRNQRLENIFVEIGSEASVFKYPSYDTSYQKISPDQIDLGKSLLTLLTIMQNNEGKVQIGDIVQELFNEFSISVSLPLQAISWESIYKTNFKRYISLFHKILDVKLLAKAVEFDHQVFTDSFSLCQHYFSSKQFQPQFVAENGFKFGIYNKQMQLSKSQIKSKLAPLVKSMDFSTRVFSPQLCQFTHPSEEKGRQVSRYETHRKEWLLNYTKGCFSYNVQDLGYVSWLNEEEKPIYCEFRQAILPYHTQLLKYGLAKPIKSSPLISKNIYYVDVSSLTGMKTVNIFNGVLPKSRLMTELDQFKEVYQIISSLESKQVLLAIQKQVEYVQQIAVPINFDSLRQKNFRMKNFYGHRYLQIENVQVFVLQLADLYDMTDALFALMSQKGVYFIFVPADAVQDTCQLISIMQEQVTQFQAYIQQTGKKAQAYDEVQDYRYEIFMNPSIFLQIVCFIVRKYLGITAILIQ